MRTTFFRLASKVHLALYRLSRGRGPFGRVGGKPVLLLTTKGSRSGKARTVPLTYFTAGGANVVVASSMGAREHPAWFRNIEREPRVWVEAEGQRQRMLATVASAEERPSLWEMACATFPGYADHQRKTKRVIPVVMLRSGGDMTSSE